VEEIEAEHGRSDHTTVKHIKEHLGPYDATGPSVSQLNGSVDRPANRGAHVNKMGFDCKPARLPNKDQSRAQRQPDDHELEFLIQGTTSLVFFFDVGFRRSAGFTRYLADGSVGKVAHEELARACYVYRYRHWRRSGH
jgi:hypothetical protein